MKYVINFTKDKNIGISGKTIAEEFEKEINRLKATLPINEFLKRESSILQSAKENIKSLNENEKIAIETILAVASKEVKLSELNTIFDIVDEMKSTDQIIIDQRDFKYITDGWDKLDKSAKENWFKLIPNFLRQLSKPEEYKVGGQ